jgi:spermidine/putrescine transport system permease protein
MASAAPAREGRRKYTGYLLIAPAAIWLGLFFLIPFYSLVASSLYDPNGGTLSGFEMTYHFQNFVDAVSDHWRELWRSLWYAGLSTLFCLVLGYVLAYAIAFKAGRWRNLLLILVIAPFFTSFLIRTLSWKLILADDGWVVDTLQTLHLMGDHDRLLATPFAVIAGLTYNFLPFMVLPLYASLEKIDHRLIEAANDLYASPVRAFLKVTWPLSLPGVVAGTLLTFIPAAGDYINARLLGSPNTQMVGNVINNLLSSSGEPAAGGALSVIVMVVIIGMVLTYVRRAGTEDLV